MIETISYVNGNDCQVIIDSATKDLYYVTIKRKDLRNNFKFESGFYLPKNICEVLSK